MIVPRINASSGAGDRLREAYILSGLMLLAWILNGACFILLANAFHAIPVNLYAYFLFDFIASFVVGFLIIIVPASLGVREGILAFLLGPVIGGPIAVLIAVVYRIVVILSEIASLLVFQLYRNSTAKTAPEL